MVNDLELTQTKPDKKVLEEISTNLTNNQKLSEPMRISKSDGMTGFNSVNNDKLTIDLLKSRQN